MKMTTFAFITLSALSLFNTAFAACEGLEDGKTYEVANDTQIFENSSHLVPWGPERWASRGSKLKVVRKIVRNGRVASLMVQEVGEPEVRIQYGSSGEAVSCQILQRAAGRSLFLPARSCGDLFM